MPPAPRHPIVDPVKHLHRTVSAHEAVREGIASHVRKEHVRREDAAAKARADAALLSPVTPSRAPLQSRPVVRGHERSRILGGHVVGGSGVETAGHLL